MLQHSWIIFLTELRRCENTFDLLWENDLGRGKLNVCRSCFIFSCWITGLYSFAKTEDLGLLLLLTWGNTRFIVQNLLQESNLNFYYHNQWGLILKKLILGTSSFKKYIPFVFYHFGQRILHILGLLVVLIAIKWKIICF